MGNNVDFQSELLRINGLLQASITELRYRCEVYRLSLRSISKVLVNVHKEHGNQIRCLTTSRPSYQAYLLNLSQKQALDRIRNVVRKASTFINGYSLVDKGLFQPPPPRPVTMRQENKKIDSTSSLTAPTLTDGSPVASERSNSEHTSRISSGITDANVANKKDKIATEISKNSFKQMNPSLHSKVKDANKEGKLEQSCKSKKHTNHFYDRGIAIGEGGGSRSRIKNKEDSSKSSKSVKTKQRNSPDSSQAKQSDRTSIVCSNRSYAKHSNFASSATNNNSTLSRSASMDRHKQRISSSMSCNRNISERQPSYIVNNGKLRLENRRARRGPSKEESCRRGGSNFNSSTAGYKNGGRDFLERRNIRANHVKERYSNNTSNKTRTKIRESLTMVRSRPNGTTYVSQGQGVVRKCLFSLQRSHNNCKFSSVRIEKVKRIQIQGKCDENSRWPRKMAKANGMYEHEQQNSH